MARVRVEVPVEQTPMAKTEPAAPHQAPAGNSDKPHAAQGMTFKRIAIIAGIVLAVVFIFNLLQDKNRLEQQLQGGQQSGQQDAKAIVDRLSESVDLPTDEVPQMRAIEDASKFTEQNPSLADIKNGDILLFFEKSKKVVVYRPSTQKAIVVVTLSQPATDQPAPSN